MISSRYITIPIIFLLLCTQTLWAVERFPPPDFVETDHKLPSTDYITDVTPRLVLYEYIDVAVLAGTLSLASYLVLKNRSRRAIFALMIFSLLYFGFWRKGCICSIGSIQNLVLSVFSNSYVIPLTVLAFFILPLAFTLFFGRTFCAAVCPLGAIQDVVLLRPLVLPKWLESGLRLCAYLYLGAAVLFASTDSAFIICRYDPFVAFFRLTGRLNMMILGACLLVIGVFIGRPYCRFLCPYGVILRQFSRLSRWHATITPDECIKCRLCEDACPFNAINTPTAPWPASNYRKSKIAITSILIISPVIIFLAVLLGASISDSWSKMNPTVRLAERIYLENNGMVEGTINESVAFRSAGTPVSELYQQASIIKNQFKFGGRLLGCFIGFVISLMLINNSIQRRREDYQTDRAGCVSCGRCFQFCPKEQERLKKLKEQSA